MIKQSKLLVVLATLSSFSSFAADGITACAVPAAIDGKVWETMNGMDNMIDITRDWRKSDALVVKMMKPEVDKLDFSNADYYECRESRNVMAHCFVDYGRKGIHVQQRIRNQIWGKELSSQKFKTLSHEGKILKMTSGSTVVKIDRQQLSFHILRKTKGTCRLLHSDEIKAGIKKNLPRILNNQLSL